MGTTDPRLPLHAAPVAARIRDVPWDALAGQLLERRLESEREAGRAEGGTTVAETAAVALAEAAEQLSEMRAELVREAGALVAEVAIEVAHAVLRREIQKGEYDIESIVRETLGASGVGRCACVVHVAPEDYEQLAKVQFRGGTEVEPDPGVGRGQVHVTTPDGLFVRDSEAILSQLRGRLIEELS